MYCEVIYIYTLHAILYRKPVIMPSELLDVIKCCLCMLLICFVAVAIRALQDL